MQQDAKDKTCSAGHLHTMLGLARRSQELSSSPLQIHCEGNVDIVFRIANETRKTGSLNLSLALRRLARRAPICGTKSTRKRTLISTCLQASFDPRRDLDGLRGSGKRVVGSRSGNDETHATLFLMLRCLSF